MAGKIADSYDEEYNPEEVTSVKKSEEKLKISRPQEDLNSVEISFESVNQFRLLAPHSVAKGMLILAEKEGNGFDNDIQNKKNAAKMMDIIANHVPNDAIETTNAQGNRITKEFPMYKAIFTEAMIKEIDADYKSLCVDRAHDKRMLQALEFLKAFQPTMSLGEALYRLSFYLIPNAENLKKSTNNLISFVKKMLLNQANNMLVDSAILLGGQGKSTVQKGLINAINTIGLKATMCHLPSLANGTQECFLENEVCIDDETTFKGIDYDSLNKVLDKSIINIKGKYIKEWQGHSIANVFVGTNFLPNDVNARRYSIRMVDENFKLIDNFGNWGIPGVKEDSFGDSYDKVVEWTTEAWINLIWYCNNYDIKPLPYKEIGFDYGLQYKIKKACDVTGTSEFTIDELSKTIQSIEDEQADYKSRQMLKNNLFILANRLKLEKVDEHRNLYSTYDWADATEFDEALSKDQPLEFIKNFFDSDLFKIQ